jgi:hypothetical protein
MRGVKQNGAAWGYDLANVTGSGSNGYCWQQCLIFGGGETLL